MRTLLLLLAILLPPFGAWLYFIALADSTFAGDVYTGIKFLMILVAVCGWKWSGRSWRSIFSGTRHDIKLGIVFGFFVVVVLLIAFFLLREQINAFAPLIEQKAASLFPLALYLPIAAIFSVAHALLEEWYWRGYVFGELHRSLAPTMAAVVGAVAFTAHHVIVLSQLFPGSLVVLFSAGIFLAALMWIWLYRRTGSLLAPWVSHMIADATIFLIGFILIQ